MSRSGKKRRKQQVLQTQRVHVESGAGAPDRVSDAHEPVKPNASFGNMLLRARTQRGLSLEDVARETRVAKRYVIALENESLSGLPGGLYNRAYVRTYAAYLGLDADSVARAYDRTVQDQSGSGGLSAQPDQIAALRAVIQQKESRTAGGNTGVGAKALVLVSMALAVLAGGVWVGARHFRNPLRTTPAPVSTADAAVRETAAKLGPTSTTAAVQTLPASEPQSNAETEAVASDAAVPAMPAKSSESALAETRQAASLMSVNDSGVGTDVVGRELVGRSEAFAAGTRIIFWTLVTGGRPGDTIRHAWFHRGQSVATVKLPISAANWRTHSQRVLGPEADGDWVVEAQDEDGRVLARHAFRSGL